VIGDQVVRNDGQAGRVSRSHPESFAEQLAQKAGSYPKPKSEYISWLLQPIDHTETFFTLSAEQVLGKTGGPALPLKDLLGDRIVLIGGNFPDRDQHLIPLSVGDGPSVSRAIHTCPDPGADHRSAVACRCSASRFR